MNEQIDGEVSKLMLLGAIFLCVSASPFSAFSFCTILWSGAPLGVVVFWLLIGFLLVIFLLLFVRVRKTE